MEIVNSTVFQRVLQKGLGFGDEPLTKLEIIGYSSARIQSSLGIVTIREIPVQGDVPLEGFL